MGADPAFLFYPGDYLRDTQCLSEIVQVAYDRIMCEHMRNICISQQQLKFFTKRMNADEIEELKSVLTETSEGFFIKWVRESINKRRAYSDSRRKNRVKKSSEHKKNISLSHDLHMENEIENVNVNVNVNEKGKGGVGEKPLKGVSHVRQFQPPEVGQVAEYFDAMMCEFSQAELFWNYYQSQGWRVGKNKMKDWRAAARGWIVRHKAGQFGNGGKSEETSKMSRIAEAGVASLAIEINKP